MSGVAERYARHVDPAFVKLLGVLGYGRVFTRASGVHVWDDQGRCWLPGVSPRRRWRSVLRPIRRRSPMPPSC